MLHAIKRVPKQKIAQYRREGKIPAIIYGHGFESVPILLEGSEFTKTLQVHGEGGLLDITIEKDDPVKVILQDYQVHPVGGEFVHVDLYRIRMDEKLQTIVPLTFMGESPAVKEGGVLIKNYTEIKVECLPQDLVSDIPVDLSALAHVRDSIKVADLAIPTGITVLHSQNTVLLTILEATQEAVISIEEEQEKIKELGKTEEVNKEEGNEKREK